MTPVAGAASRRRQSGSKAGADGLNGGSKRNQDQDVLAATTIRPGRWLLLTLAAVVIMSVAYAVLAIRVHRALQTTAFDLAFFDQIIWNTTHGRWFQTTYVPYNFLGQHMELLLLPIAALYRLGAGPETLLGLQAAAAGLAAIALYGAARRLIGPPAACMVAVAFLVSATLQRGLDFGFHPDLFEPLLVFGALAALLAGRKPLCVMLVVCLLLVKEDAFLVALPLGLICYRRCDRRLGAGMIAGSLVFGVLAIGVVMPFLRGNHPGDLVERYGYLAGSGGGAIDLVRGMLIHPDRVFAHLFQPAPLLAVGGLLLTLALTPLLAPDILVAGLPAMLVALLSNHPPQRSLDLQYGVPVLVVVMLAALVGLERGGRWLRRRSDGTPPWRLRSSLPIGIAVIVLAASVAGAIIRGPYPLEGSYSAARFRAASDSAALARVAHLIPSNASLSAQTGLAPHLSQRPVQFEWPQLGGADYAITEDGGIISKQSLDTYTGGHVSPADLGYTEIARDGNIHLYRRNGAE